MLIMTPAHPLFSTILKFRIVVALSILFSSGVFAQTQPSYFILGEKEFDGVQIYDVIQDNSLNYWMATDNGIYKYDCYNFTRVPCAGAQALSVFGFVKNKFGTIYCYNLNNQILQIKDEICSVFYELKPGERSSDLFLSITSENELLVLTTSALLFSDDGKQIAITKSRTRYYGFPFVTNKNQTVAHIGETDSILVYEKQKFTVRKLNGLDNPVTGALKFFTLNNSTFAICSIEKSIYTFDPETYTLTRQPPTELEKRQEPFRIYNENNQVWAAGVISGVQVLSSSGNLKLSEQYYSQYLISDVYQDNEGNLLLSTFNHGILIVPDISIPDVLSVPDNHSIVGIQSDNQLGMIMGTLNGKLLSYNNGIYETLSDSGSRPVQSVFSWNNFPFVLYDDGRIKVVNKSTNKTTRLTFGSLKDAVLVDDSTFYIAMNVGVKRVVWKGGNDFETEPIESLQLRCYSIEYSPADKLIYAATSEGVKILHQDGTTTLLQHLGQLVFANDIIYNDGITYVATKDGILQCVNGVVTQTISTAIQGALVEILKIHVANKKISAITASGFAIFDMQGKLIMQLNTKYGFSTNRIYDFDITGNEIWICHSKGVQQLNTGILTVPLAKPLLSISALAVNDNPIVSLIEAGVFSSDERKFQFKISSPTLRNKENIRYHYQLSGYDEVWNLADYAKNEIVYNALAPGDYTFTVKAENAGVFSDPVSYSFTITSPFYSRWWFNVLIGIVLLLSSTLIYKYRLRIQERKAHLENELHASRLTAIQSQMNPHFIFNSLNSIQDLVLKGDVDNSYTFITKFSNLVRRTLNYSDKDFVEFNQEIKLLELYLSLEKLRFREELQYTLETDGIDDIMIPPMLIQPFIENALLHGLLHKEGIKKLNIRFHLNDILTCTVEDNGVGRDKAKEIKNRQRAEHESFSGEAIKRRFSILSKMFNNELGYKYEDMYEDGRPTGTKVILTIPVKRNF